MICTDKRAAALEIFGPSLKASVRSRRGEEQHRSNTVHLLPQLLYIFFNLIVVATTGIYHHSQVPAGAQNLPNISKPSSIAPHGQSGGAPNCGEAAMG
jgi:hypothetical protein